MVIDEVARRYGIASWKKKDGALQANDAARRIVFVKPVTFMNLSGTPVRLISSWYRTPPSDVLVVGDDMDLPFGKLRMRPGGGHGGHNGLRSIIATIGDDFPRLRVGRGTPRVRRRRPRARLVRRERERGAPRDRQRRRRRRRALGRRGLGCGDAFRQHVGAGRPIAIARPLMEVKANFISFGGSVKSRLSTLSKVSFLPRCTAMRLLLA